MDLAFNEEYLRRLAAGDSEIQRHFANHFAPLLRAKLRTKLRSPELIEDIRQETLLRVLQTIGNRPSGTAASPERLGAFVNSVCNNVLMESFRLSVRHRQGRLDYADDVLDSSADVEDTVIAQERRRLVALVLAELAPRDRNLLMQVYLEERDKDELCEELHVNPEYLRVLIHRAKGQFRTLLTSKERPSSPQTDNKAEVLSGPQEEATLIETHSRVREEVELMIDKRSLFLLSFIDSMTSITSTELQELVGWESADFYRCFGHLHTSGVIEVEGGTRPVVAVTPKGDRILAAFDSSPFGSGPYTKERPAIDHNAAR